ncbi:MAG TPA: FAD-dependent oxidoreductase [Candidatus Binatia bacterium]|jgi:protoporphyrinogen oxidase
MVKPHVVILGAGPAGLGAAYQLARRASAKVTVLERQSQVGGNAGSFGLAGIQVDYGSHRLHPSCDPLVLEDIRTLLGGDLLDRPRHGRIRLCGRWIHFPLKPTDLAFGLPARFSVGVATDLLKKAVNAQRSAVNGRRSAVGLPSSETFASVLEKGLGRTICENFYFPYVQKIWGVRPDELAVTLAHRRISANSLAKMAGKLLAAVSGSKPGGYGYFFYPRHGYGQISQAYYRAALKAGVDVQLNSQIKDVELGNGAIRVSCEESNGRTAVLDANHVWSTIPITVLAKCLRPTAPDEILQAAENIHYRAMVLIYLVLEQEQFSEFDAHYFPEASIPISRLSEPKNYSNGQGPKNLTVLCAELPCDPDGPEWSANDEELGRLTLRALRAAGIPVGARVVQVVTRRLRQAYPIYAQGYEAHFQLIDEWLDHIDGLLTFGRQGLFAHDNTHHALYMAYCAAGCLSADGHFDRGQWQECRKIFESHVVED